MHSRTPLPSPSSPTNTRIPRLFHEVLDSPIGPVHIVGTEAAVHAVDFGGFQARMHALLQRRYGTYELVPSRDALGVTASLERYFGGDFAALDHICVDAGGTPYQERIWAALRTIPSGQTRSYGELAAQAGTHARAVGHANALNPIAVIVPCHRVIGANATLTGYAGGLARKAWLLEHEARGRGSAPMFPGLR